MGCNGLTKKQVRLRWGVHSFWNFEFSVDLPIFEVNLIKWKIICQCLAGLQWRGF